MGEGRADHQVGRPGVDGSHEPAKRHASHDETHALVGLRSARPVVQQQQRACDDLNEEEEQRHPAQEIQRRVPMLRDGLVRDRLLERGEGRAFVEPGTQGHYDWRETMISSPFTLTSYALSGRGGGPATLRPLRSY